MNLGSIIATLRLNATQFVNSLNQVQNALRQTFGPGSMNNINGMSSSLLALSGHLKSIERIIGGIFISQIFYRMTNEVQQAAGAMLDFMNNMEKSQIAMQYFLGDAEKAKGFIMNMEDFAAKTSFSTEQALVLSRKLMAAQFDPSKVRSIMNILNDAAAAGGGTAEQMDRIVLALTQMRTNGKIAGQELRQLGEAGIPIYKILSEELGIAEDKLLSIGEMHISGDLGVMAVLKGLEKRYKGAAEAIANTLPGMMETIRDDMKMIGQGMFLYPYKSFEGFVRKIRNRLEELREIGFKNGIGAIFEDMFSPTTQLYIRLILGSIDSIAKSIRNLFAAFKPTVQLIAGWFTQALGTALPILATFARFVSEGTRALLGISPQLHFFSAALGTVLIASTAARALLILWRVTGLGMIAAAVAGAVEKLAVAIRILSVAVVTNPIAAFFIALAGVLTYFALRVQFVQNSINSLMKTMGNLAGFNVDNILDPKINDAAKHIDGFNKSVTAGVSGLGNVGKGLDKAAKKAKKLKDMFTASFDEVFQVPEEKDPEAAGAGAGVGDMGLQPTGLDTTGIDTSMNIGKLLNGSKHPAKGFWSSMWDDFKAGWDTFLKWLSGIGDSISKWWDGLLVAAVKWGVGMVLAFTDWKKGIKEDFIIWLGSILYDFAKWYKDTKEGLIKWAFETALGWAIGLNNALESFRTWKKDTEKNINEFITSSINSYLKWAEDTGKAFSDWKASVVKEFTDWKTETAKSIEDWKTGIKVSILKWIGENIYDFAKWRQDVVKSFNDWVGDTKKSFADWKKSVTFDSWTEAARAVFSIFGTDIDKVFENMGKNMKTRINSMIDILNSLIDLVNNFKIKIPKIDIPGMGPIGGGTISIASIPKVPHLATGGIVLKDQLIRAGEGNKREAVVPLENPRYMAPFSKAVANDLATMMGGELGGREVSRSQQITNVHVGVLIGDDRSYRELERRLRNVRESENTRMGGGPTPWPV